MANFPITFPTSPKFAEVTFGYIGNTSVFQSSLTKQEQVLERPGMLWTAQFALPPLKGDDVDIWASALTSLRGRVGTFLASDPRRTQPRGNPQGAPVVDGPGQSGSVLATKGWAISQTGLLLPGDYIEVNSRLYMVEKSVTSDASGQAAIEINPPLREAPANALPVKTAGAQVRMRLVDDRFMWQIGEALITGLAFEGVEAL